MEKLPIDHMHERHHGLTVAVAAHYLEAARVCLSRHHESPATLSIEDGDPATVAQLQWLAPDERTLRAWANETDATEAGAYACALAAIELARGFFAVHRAETGTGADYYLAPAGVGIEDLEGCFRLEVSGVDRGGAADVRQRVLVKVHQARRGASNLPALAGVVGFAARLITFAEVEATT